MNSEEQKNKKKIIYFSNFYLYLRRNEYKIKVSKYESNI